MKMITKIKIRIIPNAKSDQIVGKMDDGTIKIKIRAKPVEGKANNHLVKFLAEKLKIRTSEIQIFTGKRSRRKLIGIEGLSSGEVFELLEIIQEEP